jgi:urocanate hydratase
MGREMTEDTTIVTIEQSEEDAISAMLAEAGVLLGKAASNKKKRNATLKEVEGILSKVKLTDFEDLAESPVIQAFMKMMGVSDLQPGQVINKGTLAERGRDWTLSDMAKMEHVTFIPAFSDDFTWNGVGPFRLVAGEETTVPEPIYSRYREILFLRKQSQQHINWLMGKTDYAPHPMLQTIEGARVRAQSLDGRPFGVQSATLGVGVIHENTPKPEGE